MVGFLAAMQHEKVTQLRQFFALRALAAQNEFTVWARSGHSRQLSPTAASKFQIDSLLARLEAGTGFFESDQLAASRNIDPNIRHFRAKEDYCKRAVMILKPAKAKPTAKTPSNHLRKRT